jgi:hypothetical protein
LWLGRAAYGWRVHRSLEDFFAAIEEKFARNDNSLSKRVLALLPQEETKTLISAIITRMFVRGFFGSVVKVVLWTIPTFLLFREVFDLRSHNALLEKQINQQPDAAVEQRAIQYLSFLNCKSCMPPYFRRHAFDGFISDARRRDSGLPLFLYDFNLSDMEFRDVQLQSIHFINSNLDSTRFYEVDMRDVSFENSTLVNARFESSNLLHARFIGSKMEGVTITDSCIAAARFVNNSGLSLYNIKNATTIFGDEPKTAIVDDAGNDNHIEDGG